MPDKLRLAQEYWSRAERLRAIAGDITRQKERELLMQLADEYDQMALSAGATSRAEVARVVPRDPSKTVQVAA